MRPVTDLTSAAPPGLTPAFRNTLLWIVGATLLTAFTMQTLSAAYVDGQYIPAHNDAFYHARRILDAVMTGQPIAQFDARMHVPEGSWVTWPWCYDAVMAAITRWFGPYPDQAAAAAVLFHIPMVLGVFAVAIFVWAAQLLRLGLVLSLLLVISLVSLPSVQANFAIGDVDHHFAEGMWTALTLCAGIWMFREPSRLAPAIVLGLTLGSACGVHVSLFILQLPLVSFYLLEWSRGAPRQPRRTTFVLAGTLMLTTLAICLPSQPLQQGFFQFYTLSWFHVYIAAGTCVFIILPTLLDRGPRQIAVLAVSGVLAMIPLFASADLGAAFLGGNLDTIQDILEIYNPYKFALLHPDDLAAPYLLYFLWLAAPAVLVNLYLVVKERDAGLRYFALAAAFGLVLLQLQSRLHVFGELALVATPLLVARKLADRRPEHASAILAVTCAAFLLLVSPARHRWGVHWRLAGAHGYAQIRGVFPVLKEVCRQHPGVVLADTEAGHWIRYHSDCSVIGNFFLLTPQQAQKARLTDALMRLPPAALPSVKPEVSYVLAYHDATVDPRHELDLEALRRQLPLLEGSLLGPLGQLGPQYRLLWKLDTPGGQPYARLFEIRRHP
jgi:hypothetical protein